MDVPIIIRDDFEELDNFEIRNEDYRYYWVQDPSEVLLADLEKIREERRRKLENEMKEGKKVSFKNIIRTMMCVWKVNKKDPSIQKFAWKRIDGPFMKDLRKYPENRISMQDVDKLNKIYLQ